MKDKYENINNSGAGEIRRLCTPSESDWSRLEDVGDLHFHAAAYSSALDYYCQLLGDATLTKMPLEQAFGILKKSVDSYLLLGNLDEADALLDRFNVLVSDAAASDQDSLLIYKAVLNSRYSIILRERGELRQALEVAKGAFAVLALTDEHSDVARLQVSMGICFVRMGRAEKAEEFFHDGLSTFRRIGNDLGVANILNNIAVLNKNKCQWERALSLIDNALDLANNIGASHLLPVFHLNQGIILQKTNRLAESRTSLEKGLRLARSLGDRLHQSRLYLALGRLEILSHRLARAEELVLEGKMIADRNRFRRESILADEFLGDVLLARGEVEKAEFNFQLGLEKCRAFVSDSDLEGELLRRISDVQYQLGNYTEAVGHAQAAISVCEKCGEVYEMGFCHSIMGHAYAAMDDEKQSSHHFRQAIATFTQQEVSHHRFAAILAFADSRIDSAGEADLLLLRRYLMDAQENGVSAVSDEALCHILERLAAVQIKLGQLDDALLTVFELERHAAGVSDPELDHSVVVLRDRIEVGLLSGVQGTQDHLQAISRIPELAVGKDITLPRNLHSVLIAGLERVEANLGFIAMNDAEIETDELVISAREGLTNNLSCQLAKWFSREMAVGNVTGTAFFSRLDEQSNLIQDVPGLGSKASSCVFMPIAIHGRSIGMLFLGKTADGNQNRGFDRSALDFLATYMGFLALFLHEKGHGRIPAFEDVEQVVASDISAINVITENDKMLEVLSLAKKVATSDLTVLLSGETGTGKGLVAHTVHSQSDRSKQKLVTVNCAAIPESLLESELFGHRKGSFTGADSDKKGLFAEAEGGTVFLDEIGKMPLSMQGKLLLFLDSKMVRPVGSNVEFLVNVRIICASKGDLFKMAQNGEFLEDLYYRLLDFPLVIPPLRDRTGDVELLARFFVRRFSSKLGTDVPMISRSCMNILNSNNWPGNVRELEKTLKRAMVLASGEGVLLPEHLPMEMRGTSENRQTSGTAVSPLKETVAEVECREISKAMRASLGNKSEVARMLKISYPNLLKKIKMYGIEGP